MECFIFRKCNVFLLFDFRFIIEIIFFLRMFEYISLEDGNIGELIYFMYIFYVEWLIVLNMYL